MPRPPVDFAHDAFEATKKAASAEASATMAAVVPRSLGAIDASHETRPLTLRFMLSGVDFRTRIPAEEAPGRPLTVAHVRGILLDRGLLSCAEHVQFFDAPSAGGVPGVLPEPLSDGQELSGDTIWVRQEKSHSEGGA